LKATISQDIARWKQDFREYEAASLVADMVGNQGPILNIGPSWGRDYYWLMRAGRRVINVDLAPQYHLPNLVRADATQVFPFEANQFGAVIMAELLEHLVEDWVALAEARRVLSTNGRLVVTVPFFHDRSEFHVRIHSDRSITRLLATAGFQTQRIIYRGGLIHVPRFVHAVRKLVAKVGGAERWYDLGVRTDTWLGRQSWSRVQSMGAYILATKGDTLDWRGINIRDFQH
jgi:SAM-dependent methyltransferase